jgi:hypothetical protein
MRDDARAERGASNDPLVRAEREGQIRAFGLALTIIAEEKQCSSN